MGASHKSKLNIKMDKSLNKAEEKKAEGHATSSTRPLAIEGQQSSNLPEQCYRVLPNQPSQPTNLQDLLRFSVEASQAGSQSHNFNYSQPIDEERKRFLQEALDSMTVNVVEELRESIATLSKANDLRSEDDSSEYDAALEKIASYVDSIDVANDFYKIGGFAIFGPCLNSPHSGIRWRTANIIAELSQNNPFCQERILETGLFPILLNMVDTDNSDNVTIKALYAVSCIVRGHPMALKYMDVNDGYSVLLRAIQSPIQKLQIKSAFLLSSLCNRDNSDDVKITLLNMGLIQQVTGMLANGNLLPETRDQLLNVLNGLTNNFLPALKECRRSELGLKDVLEKYLKEMNPEVNVEEVTICRNLLDLLFSEHDTDQDR
ncbi:hsp70-binding protein 1-like [Prorops nasuta]|uniref:hsp70-binding protein 1-like n=1 Tax=Prorops nasuta TaxID=863751 RepID=UPI0034CD4B1E